MNRGGLVSKICLAGGSAVACWLLAAASQAGVIATANAPLQTNAEIFTADPFGVGVSRGDRGLTTTRELYQTFQNPAAFDVKKIALSFRVTNATTGLQIKFYEVSDTNTSNIKTEPASLGALVRTIELPVGSYTTSSERIGVELTGGDIFTLPQRNTGTEGYAISISQLTQPAGIVSGNFYYANGELYALGKAFVESGGHSSPSRDFGVSISSAPEPTSAVFAAMGLAAMWGAARRRKIAG